MSSLTNPVSASNARAAHRAALRARLAPLLAWLIALLGLALVAVFVLQAGLFTYLLPAGLPPQPQVENPGQITSYDSTLTGVDHDNQPYEIRAKRGWQDVDRAELMHLEQVAAIFHRATGEPYDVTCNIAHYDSKLKEADLEGAVKIVQIHRFTARMEKAHVKVREKSLSSAVPVQVELNGGTINANGLQITNDGANILFLNGVKAHFDSAPAEPAKGDKTP